MTPREDVVNSSLTSRCFTLNGECPNNFHSRVAQSDKNLVSKNRRKPTHPRSESRSERRDSSGVPIRRPQLAILDLAIVVGLILAIFVVFAPVGRFDFVNYDDPGYVSENADVQAGLTPESLKLAFTDVVVSNWMPVTLLSHMLDCQLFHLQSGMHHLTNVVLHMLSAMLLFAWLRRATKAVWPSAFVAFVFALHPLHVESVAWVSERKDVLSTFFWFLATYAYVRYTEQTSTLRYLLVVAPFCLGLMSKPMLVTLPFTLLLLDAWPLRRVQFPRIIWEKLPLIALSAGSSAITYLVQRGTGAVKVYPLPVRIENALISYAVYIGQMFWPSGLAVIYPYFQSPVWQVVAGATLILGISAVSILAWKTRPYLATGWFWYLGTLVPVVGLVQVGWQSHADRYMYVPMIGLLLMLAWGGVDVVRKWPQARLAMAAAAAVVCVACMVSASAQTAYWQNSETLFRHAIDVTKGNDVAEYTLANYLMNTGRGAEAVSHFETALRINPNNAEAHNNLGIDLAGIPSRSADAILHFEAAVRLDPNLVQAQRNLGILLSSVPRRTPEAIAHLEIAQRLQPQPETLKMIDRLRASQP